MLRPYVGDYASDPFYSVPVPVDIKWKKVYDPKGVEEFSLFSVEFGKFSEDLYTLSTRGKHTRPIKRYKDPMRTRSYRKERVKELVRLYETPLFELGEK